MTACYNFSLNFNSNFISVSCAMFAIFAMPWQIISCLRLVVVGAYCHRCCCCCCLLLIVVVSVDVVVLVVAVHQSIPGKVVALLSSVLLCSCLCWCQTCFSPSTTQPHTPTSSLAQPLCALIYVAQNNLQSMLNFDRVATLKTATHRACPGMWSQLKLWICMQIAQITRSKLDVAKLAS